MVILFDVRVSKEKIGNQVHDKRAAKRTIIVILLEMNASE